MRPMFGIRPNLWNLSANVRHYVIEGKTLKEEKLISEGAFAFVYLVKDVDTSAVYALKKIICQENDRLLMANHEIQIMKSIPPHQNLVKYYGSATVKNDKVNEILILLELCEGGHLLNLLDNANGKISEEVIISIMKNILSGVEHLHTLPKPIAHRDLKVENILFNNHGKLKICDFGSASTHFIDTMSCSKEELLLETASIEQYTTMLYRAPEMIDLHREYKITVNIDIWMVGCILFILAFYKHPFQDSSSLAIANAKFDIPKNHGYSKKLTDLIIWMLSIEPLDRPSSTTLSKIFTNYSEIETIPMPEKILNKCKDYYHSAQDNYDMINTPYKPLDPILLSKAKKKQRNLMKAHKSHISETNKQQANSANTAKHLNIFDASNPENKDLTELLNDPGKINSKLDNELTNQKDSNWDPFPNTTDSQNQIWDPFNDSEQLNNNAMSEFKPFISDSLPVFDDRVPFLAGFDAPKAEVTFPSEAFSEYTSREKPDPFETSDPFWELNSTRLDTNPMPINDLIAPINGHNDNFDFNNFLDSSYFSNNSPLSKTYSSSSSNKASPTSLDSTSKLSLVESKEKFSLDNSISSLIDEVFNDSNSNTKG